LSDSSTTLLCQFRGTHKATINIMRILISNSSGVKSLILATGSSDFYVKIWNLDGNFCTHNLQGKSVVTALTFIDEERLIVGYAEGNIRLFNLVTKSKKKIHLECSHHSRYFSCDLFIFIVIFTSSVTSRQ
jgi:WD40 repeat protein